MNAPDTRDVIMKTARARVQSHGYNALSFRELAKDVGIKSASIHYHFPTKGDLGAALARRYTDEAAAQLEAVAVADTDPGRCIAQLIAIFRAALEQGNRMCLCGILAAEQQDLPPEVRVEVERFGDAIVAWLTTVLGRGDAGRDEPACRARALGIYAAIGGAQLLARGRGDITLFDQAIAAYRTAGLVPGRGNENPLI